MHVERLLRSLNLEEQFPPGWCIGDQRNASGLPAITISSPRLPDGLQIRSQLQVSGHRMPDTLEEVRVEFHVGIEVSLTDTCFPDPARTTRAPAWVGHLKRLRDDVLNGQIEDYGLRANPARNGKGPIGARKVPLARKFLGNDNLWLVVGYCTWALGPRTEATTIAELSDLAGRGVRLTQAWYDAST